MLGFYPYPDPEHLRCADQGCVSPVDPCHTRLNCRFLRQLLPDRVVVQRIHQWSRSQSEQYVYSSTCYFLVGSGREESHQLRYGPAVKKKPLDFDLNLGWSIGLFQGLVAVDVYLQPVEQAA
ncbi:hypothetical protein D3C85_1279200 [compost metagenome]